MITTKCFIFRFSDVEVHEQELRATRGGQALDIEPKAFRVLVYLVQHAGHLVSKSELMDAVWGETAVTENSLTRAIALLRRVLEDDPHQPRFIETVATAGYRFVCPVMQETDEAGSAGESASSVSLASAEQTTNSASAEETASARVRPRRRVWLWTLAAGIIAALGITFAAWWKWSVPSVPHVTSIDRITDDGRAKGWPAAADGSRVYFYEKIKNHAVIAEASFSGGDISIVPTPFTNPGVLDIAPDNSTLLILDRRQTEPGPLWIVPLPQGAPRRLGIVLADDATFTPDGKQVIFIKGAEIWIVNVDGSHARQLWTGRGGAFDPRVSPDGKRMRFSTCAQLSCLLWEARTDGSRAHQVLPGWQDVPVQHAGTWSPDGGYYVFGAITQKGAFHMNLWMLPERRSWFAPRAVPVQLTRGPLCFFPPVAFSPDGHTLFSVGEKDDSQLVRYDPKANRVDPFLSGIPATLIDFSRDGQWIVYITSPPYPSLWRSRLDGSERVQLTSSDDAQAGVARWSPDGTRIAFEWARLGLETKLGLISRDGGIPEQVISDREDSHEQVDPTWSADGNAIIFARDRSRRSEERMELLRADLRTRKVTQVPGSEGLFSPRWSADGHFLAAITIDMRSVRLFDFQRQAWSTWFTAQEEVGSNQWSLDGRALYFLNRKTKDGPLAWWRIGLGERTPTKVMELPDERVVGRWYGLELDGSSSYFTRDLTSTEIYAIHLSEK